MHETMIKKIKAEKEKIGTNDSAKAPKTEADGTKRGKIKEVEGHKKSETLHAEDEAEVLKLVNDAIDQYFIGLQLLRKVDALEYPLD